MEIVFFDVKVKFVGFVRVFGIGLLIEIKIFDIGIEFLVEGNFFDILLIGLYILLFEIMGILDLIFF